MACNCDAIVSNLQAISGLLSNKFGALDDRLNSIEQRLETIENGQGEIGQRVSGLESILDRIERRSDEIGNAVNDIIGGLANLLTADTFREVLSASLEITEALIRGVAETIRGIVEAIFELINLFRGGGGNCDLTEINRKLDGIGDRVNEIYDRTGSLGEILENTQRIRQDIAQLDTDIGEKLYPILSNTEEIIRKLNRLDDIYNEVTQPQWFTTLINALRDVLTAVLPELIKAAIEVATNGLLQKIQDVLDIVNGFLDILNGIKDLLENGQEVDLTEVLTQISVLAYKLDQLSANLNLNTQEIIRQINLLNFDCDTSEIRQLIFDLKSDIALIELNPTIDVNFSTVSLEINPTIEVSLEPAIEFNPELTLEPSLDISLDLQTQVDVQIDLNQTTIELNPTINADFNSLTLEINPTIEVSLEPAIEFNPELTLEPSLDLSLDLQPQVDVQIDLPELTATECDLCPPIAGGATIHGWNWDEQHTNVQWNGIGIQGLNEGLQVISDQIGKISGALTRSANIPYDSRNCTEVTAGGCGAFESRSGLVSIEVDSECPDDPNLNPIALKGKLTPVIFELIADVTKRYQSIRNEVCCGSVAIMPSDTYQEFALESRLTLEFIRDSEWGKIGKCGKWNIEIPNPRTNLSWCADFEQFGYKKGYWYVRLEWGNSGVKTGCYCHSKKEAERVGALLNGLTKDPTPRIRISKVNRVDRALVTDCVRVLRAVVTTIDPATNTVLDSQCFNRMPCDVPYQGCNYLEDCD